MDSHHLPGIYIHLPFCKVHCAYCDFPLSLRQALAGDYYQCLLQEIRDNPAPEADTLYFGGGTPSQTPVRILRQIRGLFSLQPASEITLEANPDDITPQLLNDWKECGITRISIGVQCLEPEALRAALRPHSPEQALHALEAAMQSGFDSINADLIIGLPLQTTSGFESDLDRLIALHPQHFSIYLLELHESTALQKQIAAGRRELMPEDEQIEGYRIAVKKLQEAGYIHYEVSNFALPGFESRHNLKYWTAAPYYAYGAGACSYHDQRRTRNISSVENYIDAMKSGVSCVEDSTSEDADVRMRNALIFGLRRRCGVGMSSFESAYGASPLSLFVDPDALLSAGMLEVVDGSIRLTFEGMLMSNEILSELV